MKELSIIARYFYGKKKFRWYFEDIARGTQYHESWENCLDSFFEFIELASYKFKVFVDGTGYLHKIEGGYMKVIINLKAIEIETTDIENLMIIKNQLMVIDNEYQNLSLDTPEWVTDKLGEVSREINNRVQAELQMKLKQAVSRRAALKTVDEKRKELDAEIDALKSKLG